MAHTSNDKFEQWAQWVFRGLTCAFCMVLWDGITELQNDVKSLREERSGVVQRIITVEHKSEENRKSIDLLYNRLIDHEIKHR